MVETEPFTNIPMNFRMQHFKHGWDDERQDVRTDVSWSTASIGVKIHTGKL
jgi:hypothetical protein